MHHTKPKPRAYKRVSDTKRAEILRLWSTTSLSNVACEVGCPRSTVVAVAVRGVRGRLDHVALATAIQHVVATINRSRRRKGERKAATSALVMLKLPKEFKGCSRRTVQRVMEEFGLYSPAYNPSLRAILGPKLK
jgi:hypothetical protein